MNWPAEPCILEGVPAADYHADLIGGVPTLSRSVAHTGITVSWEHAAAEHPRLPGTVNRPQSKAMDHGSLVHALLLGGEESLEVLPYDSFRKTVAQEARDRAYDAGKVPILEEAYAEAVAACEILRPGICYAVNNVLPDDFPSIGWGDFGRELTCLWEEDGGACCPGDVETAAGIFEPSSAPFEDICAGCGCHRAEHRTRCRARWDLYLPGAALLADLKVVTGGRYAKAAPFIRQLNSEEDSGAMQAASYLRGLASVHPETAGRATFVFLRVEPAPPYAVVPIVVTEGLRRLGEGRWERGVAGWAQCMASGVWPGPGVAYAQAESWSIQRELDRSPGEGGDDVGE